MLHQLIIMMSITDIFRCQCGRLGRGVGDMTGMWGEGIGGEVRKADSTGISLFNFLGHFICDVSEARKNYNIRPTQCSVAQFNSNILFALYSRSPPTAPSPLALLLTSTTLPSPNLPSLTLSPPFIPPHSPRHLTLHHIPLTHSSTHIPISTTLIPCPFNPASIPYSSLLNGLPHFLLFSLPAPMLPSLPILPSPPLIVTRRSRNWQSRKWRDTV